MSVSYKEISKAGGVLREVNNDACYSTLFCSGVIEKAKKVILHEPDDYFAIPLDMIPKWVRALNFCGFPCKYLGNRFTQYGITKGRHVFELDLKNYKYINHLASTMTLLRYMFEGDEFAKGVKEYFKIKAHFKTISCFYTLQMCFAYFKGGNHACHYGYYLRPFFNKKQLFDKFATGKGIYEGNREIVEAWSITENFVKNTCYYDYEKTSPRLLSNYDDLFRVMAGKTKYTKMKKGVYVVGKATAYANWLADYELIDNMEQAELVLFTGGEDVDPSLYNEPKGAYTHSNIDRDMREKGEYLKAKQLKIPCLGICRGSQFICVMNGGKLVQDQQNPGYEHIIQTREWGDINITSTHHQAAYPYNKSQYDYIILGWTKDLCGHHYNGANVELAPQKECEIVAYKRGYNSEGNTMYDLGIQGHPEHDDYRNNAENAKYIDILNTIVNKYLKM